MHRFYAPIAIDTVKEEHALTECVRQLHAAEITRVMICGIGEIKAGQGVIFNEPWRLQALIRRLQSEGFEVCAWVNALGHGALLAHAEKENEDPFGFTHIVGLDGRHSKQGLCPADPRLRAHFAKTIEKIAAMRPDMIMLDDDFRLNVRDTTYDIGCFCDYHMEELCRLLGERVTREELYEKAFTGGENRYRTAWMELMREALLGFAREMRRAVDAVAPEVRLGACACYDTWDMDGTDCIELARAFAGNTRPFIRTIGAPYHDRRVAAAVECTRMQAAWCKAAPEVEIFAEGDVYPRPRYTVPAAQLELFDLALWCAGGINADQKYMFDYARRVGYENGYVARHLKNAPKRAELSAIFDGKRAVGVQVIEPMHKMREWVLPKEKPMAIGRYIHKSFYPRSARLLAEQAIPTAYEDAGYPVILFGESARSVPLEVLSRGAVLDAAAATILTERGVDTGLLSARPAPSNGEYFLHADDKIIGYGGLPLMALSVREGAEVESLLLPDRTPGAYRYENGAGQRFFVLALNFYEAIAGSYQAYQNSYYRGEQLQKAIEWVAKKPLPAVCTGHPYLYTVCAKSEGGDALSVALFNLFEDEIIAPEITLDAAYTSARFVNCDGTLCGNKLTLTDIPPFGFAAFEVTV